MKKHNLCLFLMVFIATLLLVTPLEALDHSKYDRVLNRHVQGGYFDYESFMNSDASRSLLNKYLNEMSQVDVSELSEDEGLAFWLNLYNAATIKLIAKNYPVDSIKDIGGWFSGPWSKSFVKTTEGEKTLDQVEHEVIRPRYKEPRIHFTLVCAARSCPPLRHEAYTGKKLEEQLQDQTEQFFKSDKNRFVVSGDEVVLKLSRILSWYGQDFGGEDGVVKFVSKFLTDRKNTFIKNGQYRVEFLDYDWSLNQTPGPYEGFTGDSYNQTSK